MASPFIPGKGEDYHYTGTYEGVDCNGGTDDNEQKVGDVFKDKKADASLPRGVNKYGGSKN
jgi:hypothetical protein